MRLSKASCRLAPPPQGSSITVTASSLHLTADHHPINRRDKILQGISKEQHGIEIGPYFAPLAAKRQGYNCLVLDAFDKATLLSHAARDPNIPKDSLRLIEDVDLVGSATEISALVPPKDHGTFHYIVSSHNFEHLPNPIRFLQGCEKVLKPGGVLSMAVPDGRACFDFFRPPTTLIDWLEPFKAGRAKPSPRQAFALAADRASLCSNGKNVDISSLDDPVSAIALVGDLSVAYQRWDTSREDEEYEDTHCSVLTPAVFELLITECRQLGILSLEIADISHTQGCEFFVRLVNRPTARPVPVAADEFNEIRARLLHTIWSERALASAWGQPHYRRKNWVKNLDQSRTELRSVNTGFSIVAIIPLYNGARWIEEAIASVLAQTRQPDEFIVVDDGSTDDGPEIVEQLARQYPTITLLRKSNGGQSSARNYAVARSKSSLIAFLDQDDIWYCSHLERLASHFQEQRDALKPLGWVYSNLDEVDEAGRLVNRNFLNVLAPEQHPKLALDKCLSQDMYVVPSASMISRSAFESVGGFDEALSGYEDDDLFLRLFLRGYDNVFLNEALSQWRIHHSSASYTSRMGKSRMIYAEKLIRAFPNEPYRRRYWVRDCIVPRFVRNLLADYYAAMKEHDIAGMRQDISYLRVLRPYLSFRKRIALRCAVPFMKSYWLARIVSVLEAERFMVRFIL